VDIFILFSVFSLFAIIHMIFAILANNEIKKAPPGGYLSSMIWLLKRPEWFLKLTSLSFFAVVIAAIAIFLHYKL
jgi:hypothetical protein